MADIIKMKGRDCFFLQPSKAKTKSQDRKTKSQDRKTKSQDRKTKCESILNEKYMKKTSKSEDDKVIADKEKVPFDKKKYRLKKYSNKYKIKQWESNRKQKVLRKYYKEIADATPTGTFKPFSFDEDTKLDDSDIKEQNEMNKDEQMDELDTELGKFVKHPDLMKMSYKKVDVQLANTSKSKKNAFWRAKQEFKKVQTENLNMIKNRVKAKNEKKVALENYKQKKTEKFKKMNRKTKHGQPVMTSKLELLLDKIQSSK